MVVVFLLAPVLIVVIASFGESDYLRFPPASLSLKWYRKLWVGAAWQESALVSLRLATLTVLLSTAIGLAAAVALTRARIKGKAIVYAFILAPTIVPTMVTAVGFYFLASTLGLIGSVTMMAVGESVLALPIVIMIVSATLQGMDSQLERAAVSLGASHWHAFRRVTLPLIAPGVLSGAVFAFLAAFDGLLIPLFLAGVGTQALSVRIWNSLQTDLDPTIAAVSTVFVVATVAAIGLTSVIDRRGRD